MINYGGIPEEYSQLDTSKIVVLPVPYDETSTWIKGADLGPDAILDASANMELYDIETRSEVYKRGIYTAPAVTEKSTPDAMVKAVYNEVNTYVQLKKFVVTLGGEHSVSVGAIQAYAENISDLTVLQFDAHSDLRPEYEGTIYNHACAMARAAECAKLVQVGIRSMDTVELPYIKPKRVFFAHQIQKNKDWMKDVVKKLTKNVYITIDLDVFDPSIMPSTGTPEPGGLLWYDVMNLIKKVNKKCNIVGLDIVELCPNKVNKAPDFLASKLIYRILSERFENKNGKK